jgi:predicted tellurium resistance membrane protein TerC
MLGVVLIVIVPVLMMIKNRINPISTLGVLALIFIAFSMAFDEENAVGYVLAGIGVILAIIDIIRKIRNEL